MAAGPVSVARRQLRCHAQGADGRHPQLRRTRSEGFDGASEQRKVVLTWCLNLREMTWHDLPIRREVLTASTGAGSVHASWASLPDAMREGLDQALNAGHLRSALSRHVGRSPRS
jgi:hypothetical protein